MADEPLTSALAAYRRFFAGFNSRQPDQWAGALHFPHVRVSSRGPVSVVPTMDDHMAAMSWNAIEATGWDRSVEQEPEIVHAGDSRVHIAGGWTRYTKDNTPILSSHVTYVVTRIGDSWGIQSRFAVDPGPTGLTDEHVGTATELFRQYLSDWNEKQFSVAATRLNYPAVQVHPGRLVVWNTAGEHRAWLEAKPWHEIEVVEARAVQAGPAAVNLALTLRETGRERQCLVLVTMRDGHWGFQAESMVD